MTRKKHVNEPTLSQRKYVTIVKIGVILLSLYVTLIAFKMLCFLYYSLYFISSLAFYTFL